MSPVATHDSQAIALLCAPVAVSDTKPLTPSEWAKLASVIHESELERPGALMGPSPTELDAQLGLGDDAARRIASLLERGGTLAFELERLEARGIWFVTRADDSYPAVLKRRLGVRAPAVLFGAGARVVPERCIAIVGSRDADADALAFASELGRNLAEEGASVVSGAARGVDRAAMDGALERGGQAVGVVADNLVRLTQQPDARGALVDEGLTLLTPFAPEARFAVGNAMGRNRLVYCLSEHAVVVATAAGSGGTWAGALENLREGWVPLRVWDSPAAPAGNRELLTHGGRSIDSPTYAALIDGSADPAPVPTDAAGLPVALERFLQSPRTEREIRAELALAQGATRALLRRGVESGALVREGRPYRYVVSAREVERLFDAARCGG